MADRAYDYPPGLMQQQPAVFAAKSTTGSAIPSLQATIGDIEKWIQHSHSIIDRILPRPDLNPNEALMSDGCADTAERCQRLLGEMANRLDFLANRVGRI